MKVKTLTLSIKQEDELIINLDKSSNITHTFMYENLINFQFDTKPFFKPKYFKKSFKFLTINYGDVYKELVFIIKYRTKKSLNKRFQKIVNYSNKHGKPKNVIFYKENIDSKIFDIDSIIDSNQSLKKEFLQFLLSRIFPESKIFLMGEEDQITNPYIEKYGEKISNLEQKWKDFIIEPTIDKEEEDNHIQEYSNVFNTPSHVIPMQEVFYIDDLNKKFESPIIDKDEQPIQVNSHFRGSKEQKELLLKIRANKTKYSKFNK
jgi:hypothetical protein